MEIKQTEISDFKKIQSLWANQKVMFFVGFPAGLDVSMDSLKDWLNTINNNDRREHFSIYNEGLYCGELFYDIDLKGKAIIDIKIMPEFWGTGIASQAFEFLITTVFKNPLALYCFVDPHKENKSAINLYLKHGFNFVTSQDNVHCEYHLYRSGDFQFAFIDDPDTKASYCMSILADIPEWFGLEQSNLAYIDDVRTMDTLFVFDNHECIGLLSVNPLSTNTLDVHLMAIKKQYHRIGLGSLLIEAIKRYAIASNFSFLTVKTLSAKHPDIYYARTRDFYYHSGFIDFEEDSKIWGEQSPCLVMIMVLD